jgi:hypothetical protein
MMNSLSGMGEVVATESQLYQLQARVDDMKTGLRSAEEKAAYLCFAEELRILVRQSIDICD